MNLEEVDAAAKGNPALARILRKLEKWTDAVETLTGTDPLAPGFAKTRKVAPPPLASFTVTGDGGDYAISITNPTDVSGTILHELRGGTTVPINKASDVIVRGPSPDLNYVINDPGTSRYFQLRSKFPASGYNEPQVSTVASSGATPSGAIPLSELVPVFGNNAPFVYQRTIERKIVVSSFSTVLGGVSVSYDGTTIEFDVDGLQFEYGVSYYVFVEDPNRTGGAGLTYGASSDPTYIKQSDSRLSLGTIVLSTIGGAFGDGNGHASGVVAGTLIVLSTGVSRLVEELAVGNVLQGIDGNETITRIDILDNITCFELTVGAYTLTASSDFPLQFGSGGYQELASVVTGDSLNTDQGTQGVVTKALSTQQSVYRIILDKNKVFLVNGIWAFARDQFEIVQV